MFTGLMVPVQSLKVSCWDGIFEAPVAAVALPHASLTMVIELGSGSTVVAGLSSRSAVAGLQDGPMSFEQVGVTDCVEVRLSPSTALRLGVALGDLQNSVVSTETLFGRNADVLDDRLFCADRSDREAIVRETFHSVLARARTTRAVEVVEHLEHVGFGVGVSSLAGELGSSRSGVWRLARTSLGMSPQRYLMLRRFEYAAGLLDAGLPIARVAATAGYADQSHLHRDVIRFAHTSPGGLVASRDATSVQDGGVSSGSH